MGRRHPVTGSPPPSAAALMDLDADRWALLLPHIKGALRAVSDDRLGARGVRLRTAPTGRLAGGRGRRELCDLIVAEDLWGLVRARVDVAGGLPDDLARIVTGHLPDAIAPQASGDLAGEPDPSGDGRQRARDRQRMKVLREELDAARRRAAGAEARAEAAARDLDAARAELETLRDRVAGLERQRTDAGAERERAVDRERRRREAEIVDLQQQLAALRRADEERRADQRRRDTAREQAMAAAERHTTDERRRDAQPVTRIIPGRPSRLPDDVVPGTTEAVELYLHRGRRILVDGYNLTIQHRGELGLERQRAWLVDALGNLARTRGVRPTVVFDGESVGGQQRAGGARDVRVRFSGEGITADDDIVLDLESTDEPILVVTDDRELTDRCQASGADVIATHELLWALR